MRPSPSEGRRGHSLVAGVHATPDRAVGDGHELDPHYPQNQLSSAADASAAYDGGVPSDTSYLLVRTVDDLNLVVNAVAESRLVGLDCETTGLDARRGRLRLLSLDCETIDGGRFTYLVDAFAKPAPCGRSPTPSGRPQRASTGLSPARFEPESPRHAADVWVLYASARTKGTAPLRHGLRTVR